MAFPEGRMNLFETKKPIVAFGWTRDKKPFREEDVDKVADWANNPETPQAVLDSVLDGSMSIDLVDGKIELEKRRFGETQKLRKAFKRLLEIHKAEEEQEEQDPFLN